jgi:alpha-1,2-mannosyltransferase
MAPKAAAKAAPKTAPSKEKKEFVHPSAKHARKK